MEEHEQKLALLSHEGEAYVNVKDFIQQTRALADALAGNEVASKAITIVADSLEQAVAETLGAAEPEPEA
jgi:hypothetical protein